MVAAAIAEADEEERYQTKLAEISGIPPNRVGDQLAHFVSVGMLSPVPAGSDRYQRYTAAKSIYWEFCRQLYAELVNE